MKNMKKLLVTLMTTLTLVLAGSMAAYADEADLGAETELTASEAEGTEDSTISEESSTILAGETRRTGYHKGTKSTGDTDSTDTAEDTADTDTAAEAADTTTHSEHNHSGMISLGSFRTTAYCPCNSCSEGYGRHTSTGTIAQSNHTIAVDPRVIPYGSKVMINGTIYTAEDRGGGVKGKHIDIFYDTHAQTRQYGSQNVEVFLLS
jgi:3D (Asp-Asp-Asp) domain-containing protein